MLKLIKKASFTEVSCSSRLNLKLKRLGPRFDEVGSVEVIISADVKHCAPLYTVDLVIIVELHM